MLQNAGLNEVKEGDWVWSDDFNELVKIFEIQDLWGFTSYTIFVPSKNSFFHAESKYIHPHTPDIFTKERIIFTATIAKVTNLLSESTILSPLDSKVIPLPHQLAILDKAISQGTMRYLLADEVGLGKTIEAGLILHELKLRGLVERTLIVCPKGITIQWVKEMKSKFNESFRFVAPSDFDTLASIFEDENPWLHFNQVVLSYDSVKPLQLRRGWTEEEINKYNHQRVESLLSAGWDLVIMDEAHRVGGSTPSVARYQLAKGLSEVAPYVLLLSATPHQGKSDSFQRLMSLLDYDVFPPNSAINPERLSPYVFRTDKRNAIDKRGQPLFMPRMSQLIKVNWDTKHDIQELLYNEVTRYVREGYNQALNENKNYLGFLMILMQKMASSSTRAIRSALEKRLEVLKCNRSREVDFDQMDDFVEMDSQEQYDQISSIQNCTIDNEKAEVERLLSLATKCEALSPDVRAKTLLECIYAQQVDENDINLKFLIFTEFIQTQDMLRQFLEQHGFRCALLNGSMSLEERNAAQDAFSKDTKVLISTDAGGEGLNLQFCHIVVNYDLPWNPMKIEQRIGRVDRIGQAHPVKAFNFIFNNSVEERVLGVLQAKLDLIMSELGVDKTSDLLDSGILSAEFDRYIMDAIVNPSNIEKNMVALSEKMKKETNEDLMKSLPLMAPVDLSALSQTLNTPMKFLLDKMIVNYALMKGGTIESNLNGIVIKMPDGKKYEKTQSSQKIDNQNMDIVSLRDPIINEIMHCYKQWAIGHPFPTISINGLPEGVSGLFSLWMVGIKGKSESKTSIPVFVNQENRVLKSSALHIWDKLLESDDAIALKGFNDRLNAIQYNVLHDEALKSGKEVLTNLLKKNDEQLKNEREKVICTFKLKREAISRVGLDNVRNARLKILDQKEADALAALSKKYAVAPFLEPILLVKVT